MGHASGPPRGRFVRAGRRTVLTGGDGDAGRDADTVVNDGKHVDVVLHAGLQA